MVLILIKFDAQIAETTRCHGTGLQYLGSKGKSRNPLACLRNAGSYSAEIVLY